MRSRLRPGEDLILTVRRHPIALVVPAATALFVFGAFAASWLAPTPAWRAVGGAALLVGGVWALWRWLDWRVDLWAVTSQRVIDESGVLTVRTVDSPLEAINNVASEQTLLGRMFGFGKVVVQSAAEDGAVRIEGIARPEELRDAILEMKERRRAGTSRQS
ncbi:MAG TPA: PH domain-containing protein [Candidatus Cryosericum sp.]|nr:PH domain-containing protein [Candidatus Cryosericum sp.]